MMMPDDDDDEEPNRQSLSLHRRDGRDRRPTKQQALTDSLTKPSNPTASPYPSPTQILISSLLCQSSHSLTLSLTLPHSSPLYPPPQVDQPADEPLPDALYLALGQLLAYFGDTCSSPASPSQRHLHRGAPARDRSRHDPIWRAPEDAWIARDAVAKHAMGRDAERLGGAGINLILAWRPACAGPPPGHPMVPTYVLSISGVAGDAPR